MTFSHQPWTGPSLLFPLGPSQLSHLGLGAWGQEASKLEWPEDYEHVLTCWDLPTWQIYKLHDSCLVTKLCPTLWDLWIVVHQAPLWMRFPRQEYWSGVAISFFELYTSQHFSPPLTRFPHSSESDVVSQKEKNKYHILTHIYGIKKDGTDEPIHRAATERTNLWKRAGKTKDRVRWMERVAWKHIHCHM